MALLTDRNRIRPGQHGDHGASALRASPGARAWEDRLAAARQAENDLRAQQARRCRRPARNWPGSPRADAEIAAVFHAPTTTTPERKQLLRAVISEIVITIHASTRVRT